MKREPSKFDNDRSRDDRLCDGNKPTTFVHVVKDGHKVPLKKQVQQVSTFVNKHGIPDPKLRHRYNTSLGISGRPKGK